jgi:hypothetical protein
MNCALFGQIKDLIKNKIILKYVKTLIPLTWIIGWAPNNVSKWRMGFNSAFKGLKGKIIRLLASCDCAFCSFVPRNTKSFSLTLSKQKSFRILYLLQIWNVCILPKVVYWVCTILLFINNHFHNNTPLEFTDIDRVFLSLEIKCKHLLNLMLIVKYWKTEVDITGQVFLEDK